VDVLNILGVSMMVMGALCWLVAPRASDSESAASAPDVARLKSIVAAATCAAAVALATPPLWTSLRPRFLPWPLESYINGVHTFNVPQPWLFPLFPWMAFAFAGLAIGFCMFAPLTKKFEGWSFAVLALGGAGISGLALLLDRAPARWFGDYDY